MYSDIRTGVMPLAVLDSGEFEKDTAESWLCPSEVLDYRRFSNLSRQREWLAGRVAAKFLFLNETLDRTLLQLTRLTLARFSYVQYRNVCVTKNSAPGGGPASIGWANSSAQQPLAISHKDGLACVMVGGADALDLERAAERPEHFYHHTFTPAERAWVESGGTSGVRPEWLYTLLWSAKECLLKTPEFAKLTLWDMPSMEVLVKTDVARLKKVQESIAFSESETLQVIVCGARPRRFTVAGDGQLVLTVLRREN